jgi:hypothetical protein
MDERPDGWARYGRALVGAMAELVEESDEAVGPLLLETADYWLSVGLAIGTERPDEGRRLLDLVEAHEGNRAELSEDAAEFCQDVFG